MSGDCINLKEVFGDRYRVRYEESYPAERAEYRRAEAAWLMIIPCQNGHICPWGGSMLAACTDKSGPVANRLKGLPFAQVAQDGDDGMNVLFDLKHFDEVAEIMKPRRRRRLSEKARQRLVEVGTKTRFQHGVRVANSARESKVTAGVV